MIKLCDSVNNIYGEFDMEDAVFNKYNCDFDLNLGILEGLIVDADKMYLLYINKGMVAENINGVYSNLGRFTCKLPYDEA